MADEQAASHSLPHVRVPVPEALDARATKVDFKQLLAQCGGSFVQARRSLRRIEQAQAASRRQRIEKEYRIEPRKKELDTVVRLSTTSGKPSISNPIAQQMASRTKGPPPLPKGPLPPLLRRQIFTSDDRRKRDERLANFFVKREKAAILYELRREKRVQAALLQADTENSGGITRPQFKNALQTLGFSFDANTINTIFISPATEEKWWFIATGGRLVNAFEAWDTNTIVKTVSDALIEHERASCTQTEAEERKNMAAEEMHLHQQRESFCMAQEDLQCNDTLWIQKMCTRPYIPFPPRQRILLPAPPPWRQGGAYGEPCTAPKLRVDTVSLATGYRVLSTHTILCNEADLEHVPAMACSTLQMQFGICSIRLPRNNLSSLTSPGINAQITCRSFNLVAELDLSWNKITALPIDFGLLRHLRRLDLNNNALCNLPVTFSKLEKLEDLNLNHNNFKNLPESFYTLRGLQVLHIADNVLTQVPSAIPRLINLRTLDIAGNSLISLAVLPALCELTGTHLMSANDWDIRIDPNTRRRFYVHQETRKVVKIKPGILQSLDRKRAVANKETLPLSSESFYLAGSEEYNLVRRIYARQAKHEWSIAWSEVNNQTLYSNAITGETVSDFPNSLDTFGQRLSVLTDLKLDRQQLHELPESFSHLVALKTLSARENYIRELPSKFGNMKHLEYIDLSDNELHDLPVSFGQLPHLTYLALQSNQFKVLPSFVGHMKSITRLMLGHNLLETLPYELGFADSLVELQVFDNPLHSVWHDSISDLPKLKWQCRQKYYALKQGPVPIVEFHKAGLCNEILEAEPAYKERIKKALDRASRTGVLELQLEGVEEIPGAVLKRGKTRDRDKWSHPKLEKVHTLKLNENTFKTEPFFTKSLAKLRILWLKSCQIPGLNDDIDNLQSLVELNVESNYIYNLPRTFARLRRLEKFNIAKNRLQELPQDFGELTVLRELDLAMNRIESLPESISNLKNLHDFSVAKNFIHKLPSIRNLTKLRSLNIDANEIHILPDDLGELPLVVLRASHNRLEFIPEDVFSPTASKSIEYIGIAANNLLELPACLGQCGNLVTLQVDYNPLRNPPPSLISQGLTVLRQYCDLRKARIDEFKVLLEENDYEYVSGHMIPEAYHVLTGKTGFLTEEDLEKFDSAVDAYLNGAYYTNTTSAQEIIERIDALKFERETVFYHCVLSNLIKVCQEEVMGHGYRRFGCGVLIDEERPWGRKGETVAVFALSLDALVRPAPANRFIREPRPALYDIVKQRLPPSPFEYTLEVLKDAITKYEGPFGHVAQLDKVQFDRCECFDESGKSKAHRQCIIPSVVILKTIYSAAEAQRRATEEGLIQNAWTRTWDTIDTQLETRLGKLMQSQEMYRRQSDHGKYIKALKATVQEKSRDVKASLEFCQAAENRLLSFEEGGAYAFHRFNSMGEAELFVREAQEHVEKARKELKKSERELASVRGFAKIPKRSQLRKIALDLKQKYCLLEYERIIDEQRRKAHECNWRRPWDGPEGEHFISWANRNCGALSARHHESTLPRWVTKLTAQPITDTSNNDGSEVFQYNWQGTDKMEVFANERYKKFEEDYIKAVVERNHGPGAAGESRSAHAAALSSPS